ncbi:thioredoxin-disulfide reductase [bacterium (Candidatus Blackallbacteria) CG17_big_fil_post_rev_8_21_14_2_50_48_46]|uniref:Thioredoxin reductase n=1 Tax=bacterium (Candidatus Blackallbacteria) CG17_big_fil_post_rev_8_21_14_2_50_48_46 TaxID=2014261 RepID=A0A2M7G7C7_9BACT|nr:MAG: thioredoxin-disulfide reductase [bacterium (Candidatus Blackallbacteria) CG18_big_fil_WC_8_21_14_2_50_49_26]PIW17851.1 MAG: thioredoxin-disulfide reductase [bacterium (Candidatus Blackallbacteria) CG17_big_fil_post_rev_8_21_14_2_50_48_46]PIW48527.1 MAG: thioredoxin-disulfide reductase [bacterium (Candidatus Blackallbacteria) CG13_big_fil_rev_8_21_14_2_50_49_14]
MSDKIENVIIIGSGPAGYTAAIYTARANLNPLMFEGYMSGGQLMTTTDVENFPGFPEGIMGPDLMMKLKEQTERFGTRVVTRDVTSVDFSQRPFKVEVEGEVHLAHSVIISTGATAKLMGLESEKRLMGHGVSACATCDGAFFREKEVCIVGGGDSALEEANFLTRFASKVYVIHRRDKLRASKIMQDRAIENPKIDFIWDTVIEEIIGDKKVSAVRLKNLKTGETHEMPMDGVFVAIGHRPNTELFKDYLETDEVGYLKVDGASSRTNLPGVFAAGDVHDPNYRQAITAAGSGCKAAIDAERYLESLGH